MINLKAHTVFSPVRSLVSIDAYVDTLKKSGATHGAITDFNSLSGAWYFYKACKAKEISPIIGAEISVAHDIQNKDTNVFYVILLCKNKKGYKNLCNLISIANTEGFYRFPRVDYSILSRHSDGLVCILSSTRSILGNADHDELPKFVLSNLTEIFDKDFYVQLTTDRSFSGREHNNKVLSLVNKNRMVLCSDVDYLHAESYEFYDLLSSIRARKKYYDPNRARASTQNRLLSIKEIEVHWPSSKSTLLSKALYNTIKISKQIDFDFDTAPKMPDPNLGISASEYIKQKVNTNWNKKLKHIPKGKRQVYKDRLLYEMSVISKFGFFDYFAVVSDMASWARNQAHILMSYGRGSCAASLVAYLTDISLVDPIKYGLMFERFLAPEGQRVTPPDIDLDFQASRREEVVNYLFDKYSHDNCARIGNISTLSFKYAMKDAGKALGYDFMTLNDYTKFIPFGVSSKEELMKDGFFANKYSSDKDFRKVVDFGVGIYGTMRQPGTHAAGVVVSPFKISDYVPLQKARDHIVTQYDMISLEEMGFLKMDILGLTALDTISNTLQLADSNLDIYQLEPKESKVYKDISKGYTAGLFQLEGHGITKLATRMEVDTIFDLCDLIALYRPAVLDAKQHEIYLHNKHNPEDVKSAHPLLDGLLHKTHKIMIYQEDLMRVAREIAGFSFENADKLRKGTAKKIPKIIKELKPLFVKGAKEYGVSRQDALKIYSIIEKSGRYSFNVPHSLSYALLGFIMGYLKVAYPMEFLTSLLKSEHKDYDKIALYAKEAKRLNVGLLPPDVNHSEQFATIENTLSGRKIRYGLSSIKSVGVKGSENIVESREKKGKFRSFIDFLNKVELRVVNISTVKSLILCGCFDEMGIDRSVLYANVDEMYKMRRRKKQQMAEQMSIFGETYHYITEDINRMSDYRLGRFEEELMGVKFLS